jgi:hypothetical protein
MARQSEHSAKQQDEHIEYNAFKEFVEEFGNESDRAAVILGAAKLDFLLLQIIRKFLLPNVSNNDELLEGDSALSTFSARVHFCYRAGLIDSEFARALHVAAGRARPEEQGGLIDSEFARALHLIRKIRNSFAHEVAGGKLGSSPHRDRIRELAAPFTPLEEYVRFKKAIFKGKSGEAADFFSVLGIMVLRLETQFEDLKPLDRTQEIKLIPPSYLVEEDKSQKKPQAAQTNKSSKDA